MRAHLRCGSFDLFMCPFYLNLKFDTELSNEYKYFDIQMHTMCETHGISHSHKSTLKTHRSKCNSPHAHVYSLRLCALLWLLLTAISCLDSLLVYLMFAEENHKLLWAVKRHNYFGCGPFFRQNSLIIS